MQRLVSVLILLGILAGCATIYRKPPEPVKPSEQPPEEPIIDPKEEAYQAISLAVSLGDPNEAIAAYEEAQLADPDDPATQVLLANLYLSAGDIDGAVEILDAILSEFPENTDALYSRSLAAAARGDETQQKELLERLIALESDHSEALAALGELNIREEDYQAAADSFETALDADPENFVALVGLGNVFLRTEAPEEAKEVLDKVIEMEPDYSFAYTDRSRAHILEHDFVEAEADLSTAIELEPDYCWNFYDRGKVRNERREYEGAVSDFTHVVENAPDIFMTYIYRARAYDGLGMKEEAIADYETVRSLEPNYENADIPLAALYFETERYGDAGDLFEKAYEASEEPGRPKDDGLALMTALCMKYGGNEREARAYIQRAAASFPRPGITWEVARYFAEPGYNNYVLQQVENSDDQYLKGRMKFYVAAHFQLEGDRNTAQVLYLDIIDDEALAGFVETRLARYLYGRL